MCDSLVTMSVFHEQIYTLLSAEINQVLKQVTETEADRDYKIRLECILMLESKKWLKSCPHISKAHRTQIRKKPIQFLYICNEQA